MAKQRLTSAPAFFAPDHSYYELHGISNGSGGGTYVHVYRNRQELKGCLFHDPYCSRISVYPGNIFKGSTRPDLVYPQWAQSVSRLVNRQVQDSDIRWTVKGRYCLTGYPGVILQFEGVIVNSLDDLSELPDIVPVIRALNASGVQICVVSQHPLDIVRSRLDDLGLTSSIKGIIGAEIPNTELDLAKFSEYLGTRNLFKELNWHSESYTWSHVLFVIGTAPMYTTMENAHAGVSSATVTWSDSGKQIPEPRWLKPTSFDQPWDLMLCVIDKFKRMHVNLSDLTNSRMSVLRVLAGTISGTLYANDLLTTCDLKAFKWIEDNFFIQKTQKGTYEINAEGRACLAYTTPQ